MAVLWLLLRKLRSGKATDFLSLRIAYTANFQMDIGQMTDNELKAVWMYLQSLPASEQGK